MDYAEFELLENPPNAAREGYGRLWRDTSGSFNFRVADGPILKLRNADARATSVSYSASIRPNADTTDKLNVGTLTGAVEFLTPTGTPSDGQRLMIDLLQDSSGHTVSFDAGYDTDGLLGEDDIPDTPDAQILLMFVYVARTGKWKLAGIS